MTLGVDDSTAILMEDEFDINESTDRCVYYANLHCMVPVDQPDSESLLSCVQAHKAHLVKPTKLDYEALHSQFA